MKDRSLLTPAEQQVMLHLWQQTDGGGFVNDILQAFDYLADKVEGMYGKFSLAYADQFNDIPFSDPGDYVRDLIKTAKYADAIAANARENEKEYSEM